MFLQTCLKKHRNITDCRFFFHKCIPNKPNFNNFIYIEHKFRSFPQLIVENFFIFTEHFLLRNKYTNLISKQTVEIFYRKHFIDSLTISSVIRCTWLCYKKKFFMDIGTGGGFPGFILSLFFPGIFFCLIDSIQKKIHFHHKILKLVHLENCNILKARVDILNKLRSHEICCDVILTRAVSAIHALFELCIPLLKKSGKLVMMKKNTNNSKELIKYNSFSIQFDKIKLKNIIVSSLRKEGKIFVLVTRYKNS